MKLLEATQQLHYNRVTPRAGVWIEMPPVPLIRTPTTSLPVRECGLKFLLRFLVLLLLLVTPRAGVWIEIPFPRFLKVSLLSLPVRECGLKYIEHVRVILITMSLPVRECGLKYLFIRNCPVNIPVTPRAGVWIEILKLLMSSFRLFSHSPCGSED